MFYIYILIKGNHSKIFLSEITKPRALIFEMYACPNYMYAPGAIKWTCPGAHIFYTPVGLYCQNMKKSCLISISCKDLLKVLSDPSSKLFGGLDDAFP